MKPAAQVATTDSGLSALVLALNATHQQMQAQAARAQMYGKQLLVHLADALARQGLKGVSVTNLKQCRSFYQAYPKIGQTLSDQSDLTLDIQRLAKWVELGWSHYVVLLAVTNPQARSFYEIEARQGSWGVRELKRQIESGLFERLALSRNQDEVRALAQVGQVVGKPTDVIKNPYVFEVI